MLLFYNLFLFLYRAGIGVAAMWNEKARLWQRGRKGQWLRIRKGVPPPAAGIKRFWMHCASLGEFEQGRPVLEALRENYPGCVIVLTFFSPSGYEVRRDYSGADFVCYLPMDGPVAARRFIDLVQPDCALFVKYEFWHYYLKTLAGRGIQLVLISGAFRKSQPFFRRWGRFFRSMLSRFDVLTVQDKHSLQLLEAVGLNPHLTGDTRYDRVAAIAAEAKEVPLIGSFKGKRKLVIAGSTWPVDETVLKECLVGLPPDWKMIIAPHEIDEAHLRSIEALFAVDCVRYSAFRQGDVQRVLIIDNIGMLSALYRYGAMAFIGGGYNRSGIHNVLEPAVFGLPVIMGPEYKKFSEAVSMVKHGFAFSAPNRISASETMRALAGDAAGLAALSGYLRDYMRGRTGATAKIISLLKA